MVHPSAPRSGDGSAMTDNFSRAVEFVLKWEKWKSNDPNDRGGKTIWGVASRWYPQEVAMMEKMTEADSRAFAVEFYRKKYWEAVGADKLPYPLDMCAFDCSVNQGVGLARSILAKSDGDWREFLLRRIERYVSLPGQVMEGWLNRVNDLRKIIREE